MVEDDARQLKMIVGELNHRVRNTLTVVQSIVRQTLRTSKTKEEFVETFEERLVALSLSHALLLERDWRSSSFDELVNRILAPFGKKYAYFGLGLELESNAVLLLGMALHELATNCLKYGAWSEDGYVSVSVIEQDEMIVIEWRELDGPTVEHPGEQSFGSKLLRDSVPRELGGAAHKEFDRLGVVYTLRVQNRDGIRISERRPSSFGACASGDDDTW